MENKWLRVGCFLTGYNYRILAGCSEVSAKAVKRYTAAMVIISILWGFVGFIFTQRYLKGNVFLSAIGSLIAIVIIIQVERQIILSLKGHRLMYIFRGVIALMMAFIGSIIIDQILFKEDIEQQKILLMDEKIQKVYPARAAVLKEQIAEMDSTIGRKEYERLLLVDDISNNPTISIITTQVSQISKVDSSRDSYLPDEKRIQVERSQIPNPKMTLLGPLDQQIAALRNEKQKKDSLLLALRPSVEKELKENVGFLDELNVMKSLLFQSFAASAIWIIWLIFLLGLELFILISKLGEGQNDYERMILQQMTLHNKKIDLLSRD